MFIALLDGWRGTLDRLCPEQRGGGRNGHHRPNRAQISLRVADDVPRRWRATALDALEIECAAVREEDRLSRQAIRGHVERDARPLRGGAGVVGVTLPP